ncbi:thrombospondin-2-like [Mya arenaria]|uniref:thrombospondin-2-like n=1 Tax=Mya arenaria TaxID=6604 RepID=UPI0022E3AAD1|nr:thrombospondin-2-like [Mya arenaria]
MYYLNLFALVDCVLCYNCSGVADPASCQTTIVCGSNQSCYQQRGPSGTIDLGCSDKQHCLHPESTQNQGPVSIVGRDVPKRRHVTTRKTGSCFECCSTDNCNEQLCSSTHLSACVDDETVDCARMSTLFHICTSDYEHAAQICPQFCGLCDYADGQWSVWSSWSTCDVTCGSTTLTRTRTCTNPPPTNHGKNCIGESVEHKACALGQCPVDGGWSEWTSWDTCSVSCGVGIQHRERSCDNPTPSLFGQHCFGYNRDDKICLGPTCQHGIWSHWEPWTQCSTTCGNGIKHRFRNCAYAASCGGPAFDSDICIVKDCIQVKLAGNIVMVSINGGL